jgi:ubiquinone/menaquinone biosynthesis C-methylase UbiE
MRPEHLSGEWMENKMPKSLRKTGERIIPEHFLRSREAYLLYLKHLFAYEAVKKFIPEKSSVMEVGCGEGYGTNYLSHNVQHIVGLDVNEDVIQHASRKYRSARCSFKFYDGVNIPYNDSTFDVVVSFQVIEHVQDDKSFLTEIRRVLKTGGTCLLTTPNRTHRVKPDKKPWNRFHIREYYPNELEATLKTIFSEVHIWGIRGSEEIEHIEKARVKQAQRFAALDPLNLRKRIPASYETWIVALLKNILQRKHEPQDHKVFLDKYSIHNYYITKNNVKESLDLLTICR